MIFTKKVNFDKIDKKYKAIEKGVKQGKHIHLDKLASGTLQEYKRILDIAKDKKRRRTK